MRRKLVPLILLLIDIIIISVVPFVALWIRFDGAVNYDYLTMVVFYLPVLIAIRIITFYIFGLYRRLWQYASIHELVAIVGAVTVSSVVNWGYILATSAGIPKSIYVLSWFLNIMFIGASRLAVRIYYYIRNGRQEPDAKVLIFGAGDAGAMIAREIRHRYYKTKQLVGFIDDDPFKNNQMLFGAKVLGNRRNIKDIIDEYGVNEIIIAMPSVRGSTLRTIVNYCKASSCKVQIVPGIYELIDGKVTMQQLRNVDLEDLLRRDPVNLDMNAIAGYLTGKTVLVTGAGGSIASELCRQIARLSPERLILLGKGENSIYEIDRELRENHPQLLLEPVIADIRDGQRINDVFRTFKPQVVFHAGAHKHVPLMERQPAEAVRNNIFGTKTIAEAADRAGVEVFIMISTDKAVNPTSVMGATKRVAELIIQSMNHVSSTRFAAVRFGNVLGSRGSVIPLFKRQIAKGGPITITHPDMKRYFMTIPEACQLVLQAGSMASGGEVFVLDMGEPVKIVDMARDLIELSGLTPDKDIKIKFTGLRPGEKLFEELLTAEEGTTATKHNKIFVANLNAVDEQRLHRGFLSLQSARYSDEIIKEITNLVPTYQHPRKKQCCVDTKAQYTEKAQSFNSIVSGSI